MIDLLPALPRAWPSGQAFGLCARDGFVVDQTWSEGRLTRVTLTSRLGRTAVLRYGTQQRTVVTTPGGQTVFDGSLAPVPE